MKAFLLKLVADLEKVFFSRKFIAFAVVVASAWHGLRTCLSSENPSAMALFGIFAGMISSAVAVYSVTNQRESVGKAQASVPPTP